MKAVMTGCVLLAAICSPSANAQVNAQVETGSATLYGAGVFSTGSYELAPSFTPDGKRGYFTVSTPAYGRLHVILETVYDGKRWSTPKIAAFSGQYGDADPLISPDGSRLFFLSRRPAPGRAADRQDFDVWFVERVGNGWGEPRHVPEASGPNEEHYASVAADGTLYVSAVRSDSKGRGDIYRVPLINGRYGEPENLGPAINSADHHDTTAYIAPDQSYMIFSSFGRPEGGGADLYISFRRNGVWTEARNIGPLVNSRRTEYCPTVSHDGKYLYFTSERGFADSALQQRATTEHWNRLISSPGNGLGDTYRVAMKDVWAALNIPAASRPSSVSTPTSSQISLRFDYSGVEPLIEALGRDSIGDAKVDSLLAIPSIRAMVDNVIRFIPSVKVSDFGDAVKDFARTKQPATAQTPGRLFQFHSVWAGRDQVRELLKRIQANEADVIRSTLSELSAYAPNSGPITITIYFIAGGVSDGFMFEAKEHAFYANLTRANGDYNNALSNISHESYHVLQHAARQRNPAVLKYATTDSLPVGERLLATTLIEGTANYAIDPRRNPKDGANVVASIARYDRNLTQARITENFALFDRVLNELRSGQTDWVAAYNRGFSGNNDAPFYFVGYEMARAIEEHCGRACVGALFDKSPADAFQQYIALYKQHHGLPGKFNTETEAFVTSAQGTISNGTGASPGR